ncbi:MAG: BrnT family toxin [Inquilinaceae bacterium]
MFFEYDPEKSAANKTDHGMDFEEAQEIWTDPWLLEAPANTDDELRFLVIGKVRDNHWAAICVHRGDRIRIILVRRARKQEIERYESL